LLTRAAVELGKSTMEKVENVWDETNTAINERMMETKMARTKLESNLNENSQEILEMEDIMSKLTLSLHSSDGPLRLSSTRLAMRAGRHKVELCRDGAHVALIKLVRHLYTDRWSGLLCQEVEAIRESKYLIEHKIQDANATLQSLLRSKSSLQHDQRSKMKNEMIDREKCMEDRMRGFNIN
jgi:tektin-3